MVCGQNHAPATLLNYVHSTSWIKRFSILETWYVYFAMLYNRGLFITFSRYVSSVGKVYGTPFPTQNKPSHCVTVARDLTKSTKMD